jgi:hypothetical protein
MAERARRWAALVVAGAALLAPGADAQTIVGFNSSACAPPGLANPSLAIGDTAFVCVNFNGATRAVFTPKVDAFSAIQLSSCAWLP